MKFKKIILAIVLCVSMLFLCSYATPVSAASTQETKISNESVEENWGYILDNVDIEIKYLESNRYLGLYWDSFVGGSSKDGYLYLCWISPYFTKTNNTILQITEAGKTYNLYSTVEDMNNLNGNWLSTESKSYPSYNLTLHMTPIAGYKDGQNFGLPLKRTYNFTNFKYGYEGTNKAIGQCSESITFDLGLIPKLDGKNSMQLCTHGYEIIEACEAQSYFDILKYGGYGHFVHFNTTIKIDKIYRVDVAYKVVNDDKPWYQFFLPSDEHQIKKSLTSERISGGVFGLYKFQGFSEGSYQSTKNSSINYKYRLHLNYDDEAWNIFVGKEFYEADYRRISQFQILRMNYVVDGETFDVPIKMDTIEGETLFILDSDLILDTDTTYYKIKNTIDDLISNVKNNWDKYKVALIIVGCGILGIMLLIPIIKLITSLKLFLGDKGDEQKKE